VKVYRGLENVRPRGRLALAVGVFDGVHRGHQAIIAKAVSAAGRECCRSAVLTFDPPPDAVLRPGTGSARLTTTGEKLDLLASLGVQMAIVAEFGEALAEMPAEVFVRRVVHEQLRACCVVVGEDWRFGAGGGGNVGLIRDLAGKLQVRVQIVPPITHGGAKISSTRIRRVLSRGGVEAAGELLGRPYRVAGRVVAGRGRGRELGFPTANVAPPAGKLVPGSGVYACWAGVRRLRPAVVNIGVRPTFERAGEGTVEVHLLDSPRRVRLLGKSLQVFFVERLRAERRFATSEALVRQIARDCTIARERLAALQPPPDMLLFEGPNASSAEAKGKSRIRR